MTKVWGNWEKFMTGGGAIIEVNLRPENQKWLNIISFMFFCREDILDLCNSCFLSEIVPQSAILGAIKSQ